MGGSFPWTVCGRPRRFAARRRIVTGRPGGSARDCPKVRVAATV